MGRVRRGSRAPSERPAPRSLGEDAASPSSLRKKQGRTACPGAERPHPCAAVFPRCVASDDASLGVGFQALEQGKTSTALLHGYLRQNRFQPATKRTRLCGREGERTRRHPGKLQRQRRQTTDGRWTVLPLSEAGDRGPAWRVRAADPGDSGQRPAGRCTGGRLGYHLQCLLRAGVPGRFHGRLLAHFGRLVPRATFCFIRRLLEI